MRNKVIAFDLDETLCTRPKGVEHLGAEKYSYCSPIQHMIDIVNKLYDEGYTIKIYTARGMYTFNGDVKEVYYNLYGLTKEQLDSWGVKYHSLIMGKEPYDLLIDDKCCRPKEIFDNKDFGKFYGKISNESI